METLTKKLKLEFADPLGRIKNQLELLLQHLTASELLKLTEVSKPWNELIGSSKQFRKRIKLKVDELNYNAVPTGKRNYENLHFDTIFSGCENDSMLKLLVGNSNLTHLDIQECSLKWPSTANPTTKLINLKHLIAYRLSCELMRNVLSICGDKLEAITLTGATLDINFNELLLKCRNLKELKILKCRLVDKNFDDNCPFKLTAFYWDNLGFFDKPLLEAFVGRLIRCNLPTLQSITLNKADAALVATILNESPTLTKLKLNYIYNDFAVINKNENLIKLQVMNAPLNVRQQILAACPNIRHLQVDQLTKDLVDFVHDSLPQLKRLQFISPYKRKRFHCYKYDIDFSNFDFDRTATLDPLTRLPKSCCNLIFQHFSGRDVLNFSSCSIMWFNYVANSPHCMSRVKINVRTSSSFFHDFIQKSTRMYQEMRIYGPSKTCAVTELSCVFNKFHESLTRLDVCCFCDESKQLDARFKLPQLRHLSFTTNPFSSSLVNCILNNAENLECLELNEQRSEAICEILRVLRARKLLMTNVSLHCRRNWGNLNVHNQHLRELDLMKANIDDDETKVLLLACPSLETLHVGYLSAESLNFIMTNMKRITRLTYRKIDESCRKDESYLELRAEEANIDPLIRIAEELHSLIFQHLQSSFGDSFIDVSKVSKTWFNHTASSDVFMNKLTLRIHVDDKTDGNFLNCIRNPRRNYKRIEIALNFAKFRALLELDSNRHLRKFVEVEWDKKNLAGYAVSLIHQLSNHFKELAVDGIDLLPSAVILPKEGFNFSRLRKLAIKSQAPTDLNFLFSQFKVRRVREVFLENFYLNANRVDEFVEFLENNEALSDLFLNNCRGVEAAFERDISKKINFKLRQLLLPIYEHVGLCGSPIDDNLNKFLMTQMKSIVWLHLVHVSGGMINTIFTKSCNLREFGFLKITGYNNIRFGSIRPVESLKVLKLPFMYSIEFIQPFLRLAPYLTDLSVGGISDEILEHLAVHMRCLRKLNFEYTRLKKIKFTFESDCDLFEYKEIRLEKWRNMLTESIERIHKWIDDTRQLRGCK